MKGLVDNLTSWEKYYGDHLDLPPTRSRMIITRRVSSNSQKPTSQPYNGLWRIEFSIKVKQHLNIPSSDCYAYGILTTQTDNQSFQEVTKNKRNSFYIYFTSKDRTNQA